MLDSLPRERIVHNMKHCAACNAPHQLAMFGPDKRASDGLRASCRDSENATNRARWATDPVLRAAKNAKRNTARQADKDRYHQDAEARRLILARNAAWRRANRRHCAPEDVTKRRARNRLRMAVYRGTIIRPANCQQCGAAKPLHGHHTDYTKWDDVRWLCAQCHSDEHRQ